MKTLGAPLRLILALGLLPALALWGAMSAQALGPAPAPNILKDARWQNRIIVTCSQSGPEGETSFGANYIGSVDRAGFAERDILILHILPKPRAGILAISSAQKPSMEILTDEVNLAIVANKAKCDFDSNAIALIGTDGHLKKVWRDKGPDDLELFELIDAMPMRRIELREPAEQQKLLE